MKHKLIHKIAYIFFILVCFLNSFLTVFAAGAYSDLEAGTYTATIENFANSGKTQTFQMVLIPDINGYLYLDREKTNIPIKDYSGDKDYLPDELTYKNANGKEVTFDLRSTSRIDNTSGAIKVDGKGNLTSPTITQTETKPVVTLGATTPPPNSNAGSYTFLAPLPFFGGPSINIAEGGLAGYLDGLYKAGIAVATGLALIMIVAGGLEYASAGSVGGKDGGKSKIKNALIGLLLALTSFIILQQINPGLIRNDLAVDATKAVGGITGQTVDLV
ncbi:MAG: hypothetical protein KBB54_02940, partial [Candidatus Pacebacteria bacterium]|nr:hypothetical protein [Candidatus Paceibacterota bacterium]